MRYAIFMIGVSLALQTPAQPPMAMTDSKPPPTFRNLTYGSHERHVLDLWMAETNAPAPLMIYFHGGGFLGGDKWNLPRELLDACLEAGISVASANYRLSRTAPFPAPMHDGARAIQFLRFRAGTLHLDPARFCAVGNSAGAGIALWTGFKNDLADRTSPDPLLRQSTRLRAVAVYGGQSSYDPRFIKHLVGGRAYEHPALPEFYGLRLEELDTPRAHRLYEQASAINFITPDDPPVFGYYEEPAREQEPFPDGSAQVWHPRFGETIDGEPRPGALIHHPKFGRSLQEQLRPLDIECVVRTPEDYAGQDANAAVAEDIVAFLLQPLALNAESGE